MSFASLRRVLRSARKGLCSTCSKAKYPQLEAAGAGHVGCLIYTIETIGQLIKDEHNVTAMHVAARKGQIAILIYLIENNFVKGIDRAKNGATPAHDAAGTGNLDCLRYVLSHTMASASDIDNNNATPLHWAVHSGHRKVAQWLVAEGHAPIDATTTTGITPIHLAASRNHFDILRWLTGYAYKHYPKPRKLVNARDKNGCTPLYHAAQGGRTNIIRWLAEKAGGDPTIRSHEHLAPLHAATMGGHLEAVKYLFQFGSASAPGGIRTEEGACALHFAATEDNLDILKWLLDQKECTGNERDYHQSTPLHDAAKHGHIKITQTLCEKGADYTLTDIEGNTPKDLAEKNGHSKCAKYLGSLMKGKLPRGATGNVVQSGGKYRRGIYRSKRSSGEVIDNYRHAPPHQIPVNVFEGDDDVPEAFVLGEWETLRDLMADEELEDFDVESSGTKPDSAAEEKKRKLEEEMRRELEERKKKKMELLKKEKEVEMEIRERFLAEEELEKGGSPRRAPVRGGHTRKNGDPTKQTKPPGNNARRMSLPSNLSATAVVTNKGLVERRTQDIELRNSPQHNGRNVQERLLSQNATSTLNPSHHLQHSQGSLGSHEGDDCVYITKDEHDLPEPPPLPSVEYLLGKRPVNLRRRTIQSLKEQIKEKVATMGNIDDTYDSDSHSSVGSSKSDQYKRHRKKHKRKKGTENTINIEQEKHILQNSPLVVKRGSPGLERFPTPFPSLLGNMRFSERMPIQHKIDLDSAFDEVTKELEALASSPPAFSPSPNSSLSLVGSSPAHKQAVGGKKIYSTRQTPNSPVLHTSAIQTDMIASQKSSKRGGPKLLPHQKNLQESHINHQLSSTPSASIPEKFQQKTYGEKLGYFGAKKQKQSNPQTHAKDPVSLASKNHTQFINVFSQTNISYPKQPQYIKQAIRNGAKANQKESAPMEIDEIESQLNEMKMILETTADSMMSANSRHPPSPEPVRASDETSDHDSDSTEYTSSSNEDTDTSGTDDSTSEYSSDEETDTKMTSGPKRLIMARNIGMAGSLRTKGLGFNRARMLSRYPRVLGRRVVHLDTVEEAPEEIVYMAKSSQEQAITFHRLRIEQRYMKEWRKYMQIMKTTNPIVKASRESNDHRPSYDHFQYQKADKMVQRKRREVLAKAFYAWIQVRNVAAAEKVDKDKANKHYERRLLRTTFLAWHFMNLQQSGANMPIARSASQQLINAEERYLSWINEQLQACNCTQVDDIGDSLADGVPMIKALSYASKTKTPKFNPKPKLPLHRQDNWKMAHEYMKILGINVRGIEPADLAKVLPAAIHNMFNQVLKWHESYNST